MVNLLVAQNTHNIISKVRFAWTYKGRVKRVANAWSTNHRGWPFFFFSMFVFLTALALNKLYNKNFQAKPFSTAQLNASAIASPWISQLIQETLLGYLNLTSLRISFKHSIKKRSELNKTVSIFPLLRGGFCTADPEAPSLYKIRLTRAPTLFYSTSLCKES